MITPKTALELGPAGKLWTTRATRNLTQLRWVSSWMYRQPVALPARFTPQRPVPKAVCAPQAAPTSPPPAQPAAHTHAQAMPASPDSTIPRPSWRGLLHRMLDR